MTRVGTVIEGKYEILKEIGRGGMSVVYLANDTHLNRNWAVKEVRKKGNGKNHKVTVPATSIVWDGKVVGIPCYKIDGAYYVSAAAIAELTDSRFEDTHYGWSIAPLLPNKIDAYG